jgi:flagellin-like hook-associated protein FlgL
MSIRITDSYLSSILVGDLNRSLTSLLEQQRMAGSMQRVNSYADDPRAVSAMQRLNSLINMNNSYLSNISRSRTLVDGTDIALQDLSEILADARVIALRESSSLANAETMSNSAVEVEFLVGRMLEILNSSIEGHYLFAGQRTDAAPFQLSGGTVIYVGDNGEISGRTGPNSTMPLNISGDIFMGSQASSLAGRVNLGPALRDTTLLTDLNLGGGWQSGSISITVGNGTSYRIDLSDAVTVGDVISRIQIASKGAVTAAIATDGQGLVLSGSGPLTVGEIDGGSTAGSLGINAATDGGTLRGADIRIAPDRDTLLSDIPSLAGNLPLGSLEISWESGLTNIDLGTAQTLGDVQDLFASALPGMELLLQDGFLQVVGSSSAAFTIRDVDGTNTASALGISGEGTPVRLFGVMEDLQAALTAGDKDAVQGAVSELLALGRTISGLLIKTGGRQNDLDWAEGILLQRDERLRANLSLERDVDVARVAADLSRAEASYQASLYVTSKLFGNNLMQYLR